jgi:hypothetical protein
MLQRIEHLLGLPSSDVHVVCARVLKGICNRFESYLEFPRKPASANLFLVP